MSPNRRIVLNIVATYGRSLYSLLIGLFCGRWTLMVLGEEDYGLFGVVGGMTAFMAFLNGVMASGVSRFYAISSGEESKDFTKGLEKSREWFTTAVIIHTVLPCILLAIGYPIGEWAIRNYLAIPSSRIDACVGVWRMSCLSCFVAMASVPYHAMYGAKQEIAELTIYSFVTATLNVVFLYYALTHPRDWLFGVSACACMLSISVSLIISVRSFIKYPECRFRGKYVRCWSNVVQMLRFSGWLMIGNLASVLGVQGVAIFLNRIFGARVNAAANVGNTLTGQCQTLSGSMSSAFSPAIMNAYGASDFKRFYALTTVVNKVATLLILVFAIPLALEVNEVLVLWLKSPPEYAAGLCVLGLLYAAIDKLSWGCCLAVYAVGKMALYEIVLGGSFLLVIPLAYVFYKIGFGVYCAAWSLVVIRIFMVAARVVIADRLMGGFSLRKWVYGAVFPLVAIGLLSGGIGSLTRLILPESFCRVCLTTVVVELVLLTFSWFVLLGEVERSYIVSRMLRLKQFLLD